MLYSSSSDSAMSSGYLARVALLSGFLVNTAKWVAANPRTNPTRSRKDSMVSVSSRLLRHLHSPSNMVGLSLFGVGEWVGGVVVLVG